MDTIGNQPDGPAPLTPAQGERVYGFDVARALALLGMIVVHFSDVMGADLREPAWISEILSFLDGRAAATFVVLAGIGISLLSRHALKSAAPVSVQALRRTLCRRGLFLLALGFLNLIIWPGDILRVYGVSLLVAALLVSSPNWALLFVAIGFELGFIVVMGFVDFSKNWEWETLTYRHLWSPEGIIRNLFFDGFRSVLPWTGLVLFGMWLGRLELRDPKINRRVSLSAIGVVLATEFTSWLCLQYFRAQPHGMDPETIVALFGTQSMPALPLFMLSALGTAVAVIALCTRLTEGWTGPAWRPLVATGQMALTWYFAHIVVGLGTILALDLASSEPLPVAAGCGVSFFALAVLLSWLYKKKFRHGPLEWIMRAMTS